MSSGDFSRDSPTLKFRTGRSTACAATVRLVGVAALLLVVASLTITGQAPPRTLALVSTAWTPFTNEQGQPRFALDLVETALGRMGRSVKTAIVPAASYTRELLAGTNDGSAAAWKDDERVKVLMFSAPYLENRLVLVARSQSDVSAKSLTALAGKRIAIVEGYSYGDAVERGGPVFIRSRSEEDSLARLLKGEVDYTLMDDLVVQYIVDAYPKESAAKLQIGSTPLITRELFLAVRRTRPDAQAIIDGFNSQVRQMIADRTYHRLLHVQWIRADVNGDGIEENVPSSDRVGPASPERVYRLFSKDETPGSAGFYLGGNIYSNWASVPESFREVNPDYPDPSRSTGTIFKFTF